MRPESSTASNLRTYGCELIVQAQDDVVMSHHIQHANAHGAVIGDSKKFLDHVREVVLKEGLEILDEVQERAGGDVNNARALLETRMQDLRDTLPLRLADERLGLTTRELPAKPLPNTPTRSPNKSSPNKSSPSESSISKSSVNKPLPGKPLPPEPQNNAVVSQAFPRQPVLDHSLANKELPSLPLPSDSTQIELPVVVAPGEPTPETKQRDTSAGEAVKTYLGAKELPRWLDKAINQSVETMSWVVGLRRELARLGKAYASNDEGSVSSRLHDSCYDVTTRAMLGNDKVLSYLEDCRADRLILKAGSASDPKFLTLVRDCGGDARQAKPTWHSGLDPSRPLGEEHQLLDLLNSFNPDGHLLWVFAAPAIEASSEKR